MDIKYNKQKQEMRDDPVIDWLLQAKEFIKSHGNALMGAGIAIVAVVGIGLIYMQMRNSSNEKAQEAFGKAMIEYEANRMDQAVENFKIVADNHRQTSPAALSAYMLGSIYLKQARYDEAITWFEMASGGKNALEFISGQAFEGIADAFEAKGDVAGALSNFEKVLKDKRVRHRHAAIRWKMALLNRTTNATRVKALCREIISDSAAVEYKQRAENLLATIEAGSAS